VSIRHAPARLCVKGDAFMQMTKFDIEALKAAFEVNTEVVFKRFQAQFY
jgi:hypothetical protein